MPSCHPKTDHALCTNTVIFPLILGLYFCCNAKENRKKKKKCEPVNTFRVPDSEWLDSSQFPSTFFKHLFIQGRYCWACPACSIEALCIQALWRCIMEMPYAAAVFHRWLQCSPAGRCWGLAALPGLLIAVEGQESICHFRYPQRVFLAGSQI